MNVHRNLANEWLLSIGHCVIMAPVVFLWLVEDNETVSSDTCCGGQCHVRRNNTKPCRKHTKTLACTNSVLQLCPVYTRWWLYHSGFHCFHWHQQWACPIGVDAYLLTVLRLHAAAFCGEHRALWFGEMNFCFFHSRLLLMFFVAFRSGFICLLVFPLSRGRAVHHHRGWR